MTSTEASLLAAVLGVVAAVVVPFISAGVERRWSIADRASESRAAKQRKLMIDRVYRKWIKDVYQPSIQVTGEMAIGYEPWPDVAASSGPPPGGRASSLEPYLSESGSAGLLILGGPGSGKTTAALQFLEARIDRVRQQQELPIPVFFLLSSWADSHRSLEQWLVEQLQISYKVPRDVGRQWATSGEILPVLDGLDEVPPRTMSSCLEAVFGYLERLGPGQVVMTCRTDAYEQLDRAVDLDIVELQEITEDQALEHLPSTATSTFGSLFIGERHSTLFRSPLMVNLLAQSLPGGPPATPAAATVPSRVNALFELYVVRMLGRRPGRYPAPQVIDWLTWLAQSMNRLNVGELRVDRLGLSWVESARMRATAMVLVAVLAGGIVGVVDGIVYALVFGRHRGLINGFLIGVFFALFDGLGQLCARRGFGRWRRIAVGAGGGLVLAGTLSVLLDVPDGVLTGSSFVLIFAVFSGRLRTDPVEELTWDTRRAALGLISGGVLGAMVGLIYGFGYGLIISVGGGVVFDLAFAFAFGLFGALIGGLVPGMSARGRPSPNEGTRRAAFLALGSALITGPLVGLVLGVAFHRLGVPHGFGAGFRDGTVLGLAVGTLIGGLSALQHIAVRVVLCANNSMPVAYIAFLDQVSDQLLLRKSGGGYLFVHRLLLHYLADLDPDEQAELLERAYLSH